MTSLDWLSHPLNFAVLLPEDAADDIARATEYMRGSGGMPGTNWRWECVPGDPRFVGAVDATSAGMRSRKVIHTVAGRDRGKFVVPRRSTGQIEVLHMRVLRLTGGSPLPPAEEPRPKEIA